MSSYPKMHISDDNFLYSGHQSFLKTVVLKMALAFYCIQLILNENFNRNFHGLTDSSLQKQFVILFKGSRSLCRRCYSSICRDGIESNHVKIDILTLAICFHYPNYSVIRSTNEGSINRTNKNGSIDFLLSY